MSHRKSARRSSARLVRAVSAALAVTIDNLTIDAGDLLTIANAQTLTLSGTGGIGSLNLAGTLNIAAVANTTTRSLSSPTTFSGGGVIVKSFTVAGDVNLDGLVNNRDIAPFVEALTGGRGIPSGDPDFASLLNLVSEPATLGLLLLSGLLPLRRRC